MLTDWSYCSLALNHQYIPTKHAHSFVLLCILSVLLILRPELTQIFQGYFSDTGQSQDWLIASETTLKDMGKHHSDVTMSAMGSQITGVSIVCAAVCSGTGQRKYQSSASPAFFMGIYRWQVDSPHKGPVTRKMFPLDDVIIIHQYKNTTKYEPCAYFGDVLCIHCDDVVLHVGGATDGQAKSTSSSDHAVKTGLKYPLSLTTSQQHFVVIQHLHSLTLCALTKVLSVHKILLRECWSRRPFKNRVYAVNADEVSCTIALHLEYSG